MCRPLVLLILFLFMMGGETDAASPAGLVSKGNGLYQNGKYDEALSAYDEASVQAPESPQIYFNKGTALYRKGDFEKAKEAFEAAALKTKDIKLEALARFNLGDCSFSEGERQKDSDLKKALEACQTSVRHYQDALAIDPGLKEAAENIEVVRLVMKNILDEINKQKESAEKEQAAAEKLKKLIQRQQELLDRNHYLSEKNDQKGASPDLKEKFSELSGDQKAVEKETRDLAAELPPPSQPASPPQAPPPSDAAKQHLETAAVEQENAAGKLAGMEPIPAQENQKNALDELNKALAALSGNNDKQCGQKEQKADGQNQQSGQNQDPDKPGEKGQDKQHGEEAQGGQSSPQKQEGAGEEMQQQGMAQGDAQSILDEENENAQQRRTPASGGYSEVDRDW